MAEAVMLFAAGHGTRMAPLTDTRPKPLIEVAGRSLLDHALALTDQPWVTTRVVNIHYLGDQIRQHLDPARNIQISDETESLLETGGGLRNALPLLGHDPVYTLNTDAVWTDQQALAYLKEAWDPALMDALLLLVPSNRAHGHQGKGDFRIDPNGRLSRGGPLTYTGAQFLTTKGLVEIPDDAFSVNRLWDLYAAQKRLFGTVYPGHWADVGRPDGIPIAEKLLRAHT